MALHDLIADVERRARGVRAGACRRGETYGYELVGTLASCGLSGIAEGTLYPLLMRLEKKGFISSTYRESEMGPRRKYYRITPEGAAEIDAFAEEFGGALPTWWRAYWGGARQRSWESARQRVQANIRNEREYRGEGGKDPA